MTNEKFSETCGRGCDPSQRVAAEGCGEHDPRMREQCDPSVIALLREARERLDQWHADECLADDHSRCRTLWLIERIDQHLVGDHVISNSAPPSPLPSVQVVELSHLRAVYQACVDAKAVLQTKRDACVAGNCESARAQLQSFDELKAHHETTVSQLRARVEELEKERGDFATHLNVEEMVTDLWALFGVLSDFGPDGSQEPAIFITRSDLDRALRETIPSLVPPCGASVPDIGGALTPAECPNPRPCADHPDRDAQSGNTVREFVNELGNRIRITIEGPTSTSENTVTLREFAELRTAILTHGCVTAALTPQSPDQKTEEHDGAHLP